MPIFIAALIGGLASAAGSLVGRALIALGIGVVSYTGIQLLLDQFKTAFLSHANDLGPTVLGVLGVLHIGACFSIIASAIAARLTLDGLTSGTVKRWVIK